MKSNQRQIFKRMLSNANRYWGNSDLDSENAYDPLVGLLMSACAWELSKINEDIYNSRSRITERIVQLMTPAALTTAVPAHSITSALPIDDKCTLKAQHQFYYTKRVSDPDDPVNVKLLQLVFSPVCHTEVLNCKLKYTAYGNTIFSNDTIFRDVRAEIPESLPQACLYLGLECDEELTDLNGLRIYLDVRNEELKGLFSHILKQVSISVGERTLISKSGLNAESPVIDINSVFKNKVSANLRMNQIVNQLYDKQFISITDETPLGDLDNDAALKNDAKILSDTLSENEKVIWLKLQFPESFSRKMLDDIKVVINAFPVVNAKLNNKIAVVKTKNDIHILDSDDEYFDLESVTLSNGTELIQNYNTSAKKMDENEVLVKHGGIERFDDRNAKEHLDYLMELMHDESASFNAVGREFVEQNLKSLNKIITRLENKLANAVKTKSEKPGLLVKTNSKNVGEAIYINYWTTKGATANRIKAGSELRLLKGNDILPDHSFLVCDTEGGRDKPSTNDRINAYRMALLTDDRIVTREDIKAYCHYLFGDKLGRVEVEKGIGHSVDEHGGYIRTLNVVLSPASPLMSDDEMTDWNYLCKELKAHLELKGSNILPYTIVTKPKELTQQHAGNGSG